MWHIEIEPDRSIVVIGDPLTRPTIRVEPSLPERNYEMALSFADRIAHDLVAMETEGFFDCDSEYGHYAETLSEGGTYRVDESEVRQGRVAITADALRCSIILTANSPDDRYHTWGCASAIVKLANRVASRWRAVPAPVVVEGELDDPI